MLNTLSSALLLLFAWLSWGYLRQRRTLSNARLPPGPPQLPVIGNVLDFPKEFAWKTFTDWGGQYGDIVSLNLLGQPVIIINSLKVAKELLEKKSSIYSSRPPLPHMELMGITSWSVGFKGYSDAWKAERKIAEYSLRPKAAAEYLPMQTRKAHDFLRNVLTTPEAFVRHIRHFSTAVIMSVAYGYDIPDSDSIDRYVALAQELIERGLIGLRPSSPVNIFPPLKYLPSTWPGMGWKVFAEETMALSKEMVDAPFSFVKESLKKGTAVQSLSRDNLTSYANEPTKEEEQKIKHVAATLYSAAVDSYCAIFASFFLALVLHPEAQKKAQVEIDSVIGTDRLPTAEDRPSLPFVDAFCKELLRWRPVATLGIPHATTEDDVYNDYFIPKGSHVFANSWAMLHNPERFPEPEAFKPERFITPDGQFKNDAELSAAFGFGRRVCAGRHLADWTLWVFVVSVLSTLTVGKAKDENGNEIPVKDEYTGHSGLVCTPLPFKCSVVPRREKAKELVGLTSQEAI